MSGGRGWLVSEWVAIGYDGVWPVSRNIRVGPDGKRYWGKNMIRDDIDWVRVRELYEVEGKGATAIHRILAAEGVRLNVTTIEQRAARGGWVRKGGLVWRMMNGGAVKRLNKSRKEQPKLYKRFKGHEAVAKALGFNAREFQERVDAARDSMTRESGVVSQEGGVLADAGVREAIVDAVGGGATMGVVARLVGMPTDALRALISRDVELRRLCLAAEAHWAMRKVGVVSRAADEGDVDAATWLLTRHPVTKEDFALLKEERGVGRGFSMNVMVGVPMPEVPGKVAERVFKEVTEPKVGLPVPEVPKVEVVIDGEAEEEV